MQHRCPPRPPVTAGLATTLVEIDQQDLMPGMLVVAPHAVCNDAGVWRPLAEIWPDHPSILRVELWNDDGESMLTRPGDDRVGEIVGVDLNQLDYPDRFLVVQ